MRDLYSFDFTRTSVPNAFLESFLQEVVVNCSLHLRAPCENRHVSWLLRFCALISSKQMHPAGFRSELAHYLLQVYADVLPKRSELQMMFSPSNRPPPTYLHNNPVRWVRLRKWWASGCAISFVSEQGFEPRSTNSGPATLHWFSGVCMLNGSDLGPQPDVGKLGFCIK